MDNSIESAVREILKKPYYLILLDTLYVAGKSVSIIKIREIRGEVGKKTPKKDMDNHSFLMTSHG